jgi:GT2 family glycosyltransferase
MQEPESPQPPGVSVLIVSYNRAAALRRCLAALERSTDREKFEIIVVDNGSQDETPEVQAEFPELTNLRLPRNFGLAKALNIAMRTAKADLWLFLNPRTEVEPETVAELAKTLGGHTDAVAVCPSLATADGRPAPYLYRLPRAATVAALAKAGAFEPAEAPEGDPAPVEFAGFAVLLVRGYFLKGLRYIDERYAQSWADAEVAAQIARVGRSTLLARRARALWHEEDDLRPSMPPAALALLEADWVSGAATYAGKYFGFLAALKVRLLAILRALGGLRIPQLVKLAGGQKIDGTQTVM